MSLLSLCFLVVLIYFKILKIEGKGVEKHPTNLVALVQTEEEKLPKSGLNVNDETTHELWLR